MRSEEDMVKEKILAAGLYFVKKMQKCLCPCSVRILSE